MNMNKGFTIVETLVAITILMIAIAGPLVVASKGLFGANISKDQMIASYLAQETMEVVKNIRDNNLYSASPNWLSGLDGCVKDSYCDGSAIDGAGANPSILSCPPASLCRIYSKSIGYTHNPADATPTPFYRGFHIHNPNSSGECVSSEECSVTVEVVWSENATPYSVKLTSELTSILR